MENEKKQETREERHDRAMKKIAERRPSSSEDLDLRFLSNNILMAYQAYKEYIDKCPPGSDQIELHRFIAHYILSKKILHADIPIQITKTKNADTRSATEIVKEEELLENSKQHIADVRKLCGFCAKTFTEIGRNHDFTKIDYIKDFYNDFKATQEGEGKFDFVKDGTWAKMHYRCERHHLSRKVPENVDLFDIMEMIIDNITAGLARGGSVRDGGEMLKDPHILMLAYVNTIKLLTEVCEVVEDEKLE